MRNKISAPQSVAIAGEKATLLSLTKLTIVQYKVLKNQPLLGQNSKQISSNFIQTDLEISEMLPTTLFKSNLCKIVVYLLNILINMF